MNPKNWNPLCWVFLALWLMPCLLGVIPFNLFNTAPMPDGVVKQLSDGTEVVVYNGWRVGWPFPFIEISEKDANGATTRKYDPVIGLLNLVLVMVTLAGIVVVVQTWFRQFSIRTLLVSIGGLAVLIVLTKAMFSGASHNLKTVILMTVYFSPLLAFVVLGGCTREKPLKTDETGAKGNGVSPTAQPQSKDSSVPKTIPDGNYTEPIDTQRLQGNSFADIAQSDLCWRFGASTVEITFNDDPIPAAVVKAVLADDSQPRKIVASWELTESNSKLHLLDLEVDGRQTNRESTLLIRAAGEAHLDLGSRQYRIVSRGVRQ